MTIKKVAVIGAGTMGVQIAVHIGGHGYDVSLCSRHPEKYQNKLDSLRHSLKEKSIPAPEVEKWLEGAANVRLVADLKEAVREADLVVEAVSEDLKVKQDIFALADSFAPQDAILSTTSSAIPVSRIEGSTGRPDRCLNLHFYQAPMRTNMVDLMGGSQTAPEAMEAAEAFVRSIGCVPLVVNKEILGFGFVRILHSIYQHTLSLWAGGYVDFRDIDRAWMIFTRMDRGPFGIMDGIGLDVLFDLLMIYYEDSKNPKDRPPQALKEMIDRRELGKKTGRGFYTYPDPEYARPDFLKR